MAKYTLQDVQNYPANFLYLFADDAFLSQMDRDARITIRTKKANQTKLLYYIAGEDWDKFEVYKNYANIAFQKKYHKTPQQALDILAAGGEIAGKDWSNGVYGVGAIAQRYDFAQNTGITVNPETGVISHNGNEVTCTPVYGKDGRITNQNAIIGAGTYSSIYDDKTGKYYAYQYCPTDGNGKKYNAAGEELLAGTLTNNMWQDILGIASTVWDWIAKIISFFMGNFGSSHSTEAQQAQQINSENTVPSQKDGFITTSSSTGIIIIGAAAALLLAGRRRKAKKD